MSKITVIGAWNTGTNLIQNILVNNECTNLETGNKIDIYKPHQPIWKHNPKMALVNDVVNNKNNIVVIMYRNIYSWVFSMLKHSYEVKMTTPNNVVQIVTPRHGINICFKNIIHLYNHYYTNYRQIAQNNKNVVLLDYNKIIDKNMAFDYINYKFAPLDMKLISYDKLLEQLDKPAKDHGKSVKNASEAIKQLDIRKEHIINMLTNEYPLLLDYIQQDLIDFYENDYHT